MPRDKDLITRYNLISPPLYDYKTVRISRAIKIVKDTNNTNEEHFGTFIVYEMMKNRRNEEIDWDKLYVLESILDEHCNSIEGFSPTLVNYIDYSVILHKYALRIQMSFEEEGTPFTSLSIFEKGIMFSNLRKHIKAIIYSITNLKQKGVLVSNWLKLDNVYVDMDNFGIKLWNFIHIQIEKENFKPKLSDVNKKNRGTKNNKLGRLQSMSGKSFLNLSFKLFG